IDIARGFLFPNRGLKKGAHTVRLAKSVRGAAWDGAGDAGPSARRIVLTQSPDRREEVRVEVSLETELRLVDHLRHGRLHLVEITHAHVEKQGGRDRLIVVDTRSVVPITGWHRARKVLGKSVGVGRVPSVVRVIPGELFRRTERLVDLPGEIGGVNEVDVRG